MVPGENIMSSWAHENLDDNPKITTTLKAYIKNETMNYFPDHFIQYSNLGPIQPWKMLLLEKHTCHRSEEFSVKAGQKNLHLQILPSHETHALQPLDVSVLRQ